MTTQDRVTLKGVLAAFDEHLRRTRGLGAGTRGNYARFVRTFLLVVYTSGRLWASERPSRLRGDLHAAY